MLQKQYLEDFTVSHRVYINVLSLLQGRLDHNIHACGTGQEKKLYLGFSTVENIKIKMSLKKQTDFSPFLPSLQRRVSQLWKAELSSVNVSFT